MKKKVWFSVIVLILLVYCPLVMGELTDAISTRTAIAPSGPLSPVVPYADVFWGDSRETVERATGGKADERDGESVVIAAYEIKGIPRDVQIIYYFDDNGLCRVEAVASRNMPSKLTDFSSSEVAKALKENTKDFFEIWLNRYFWHGSGVELFMAEHTVAGMRCRGTANNYRLSVVYYPPVPFDITNMEKMDGIAIQEVGEDIQYYPTKPTKVNINTSDGIFPIQLFEMVRVREYTKTYIRIPFISLIIMYNKAVDLGDVEYLTLTVDGIDYRFADPVMQNSEKSNMATITMGGNSLVMWNAIASTEQEIGVVIKADKKTLRFSLPEEERKKLISFYEVYRESNGLADIALDYASDNNEKLTIIAHEEISINPEYTIDTSAVPFMELDWKEKLNNLSKTLGIKAEKNGSDSIFRSTVTIDGLGENLSVEFRYKKNALDEISVTLPAGTDFSALESYINNFVGDATSHRYTGQSNILYLVTERTEFAIGQLPDQKNDEMKMLFFPAQHYSMDLLKKNRSLTAYQNNDSEFNFYDAKPKMFEHPYTYQGRRYTYSFFTWNIRFREYTHDVGRMPVFYLYLDYSGIKDPSTVKYMTFEIGGDFYRFMINNSKSELERTEYGEYHQAFVIWLDKNNYPFFQKIAKGGKVNVTLQGDGFSLPFTMPNETRTQLVKGLKLFEQVGGLSSAALTFGLFMGTPMTMN